MQPPLKPAPRRAFGLQTLAKFSLPAGSGLERSAVERVAGTLMSQNLPEPVMEAIRAAVARAVQDENARSPAGPPARALEIEVILRTALVSSGAVDRPAGRKPAGGWGFYLTRKTPGEEKDSPDTAPAGLCVTVYQE